MTASIGFDIFARDRASQTFNKIGDQAEHSGSRIKSWGATAAKVFGAVAVFEGVKEGVKALGEMAKNAAEDEAGQRRLAVALHNTAGATKAQVAGVESYISKVGVATGVTDDEMRPAFQKLVQSTGDIGKAQKLMSVALDASAGSGKSLEAVTTAMSKANNGNMGALSKLGIKIKDVHGKTLGFKQVTQQMADTFHGQAQAKAQSFDGQMARLKLVFDETKESIGARLLPILSRFGSWFLSTGLPAIQRFGGWLSSTLGPIFRQVGDFIRTHVLPAFQRFGTEGPSIMAKIQAKVGPLVSAFHRIAAVVIPALASVARFMIGTVVPAVIRIWTVVASKLRPVFDQLVSTFKSRVAPTLVLVANKFREWWPTIQKVIMVVLKVEGAVLKFAAAVLGKVLPPVIRFAGFMLSVMVPTIIKVIEVAARIIGVLIKVGAGFGKAGQAVAQFAGSVKAKITQAIGYVAGLPGKISSAVGNLGHLLWNAGSSVIQGLIDGVTSKISALTSKLHFITSLIPKHKGPLSKDRMLLSGAGQAIMDGLINGIEGRTVKLKTALGKVTAFISATGQRLQDLQQARSDMVGGFSGMSSSVFGADYGEEGASVDAMLSYQRSQMEQAQQLQSDVMRLVNRGLSKSLLQQMASSGAQGMASIHALTGASAAQIDSLNAMDNRTADALQSAGAVAAGSVFGDRIDNAQRDKNLAEALAKKLAAELKGHEATYEFVIKGDTLVGTLKSYKRAQGNKKLGLD